MSISKQIQEFFRKVYLSRLMNGELNLVRFYSLCGIFIPITGYLFIYNGKVYPLFAMIGFSVAFASLFFSSFLFSYVQKNISRLFLGLLTLVLFSAIGSGYINGFTVDYTFGLIIGAVVITLVIIRLRHLAYFSTLLSVLLLVSILLSDKVAISKSYIFFFLFFYTLFVFFFLRQRIKLLMDLEDNERLLSKIVDTSNDAIFLLDFVNLKPIRYNERAMALFDLTPEDLAENLSQILIKQPYNTLEYQVIYAQLKEKGTYTAERECVSKSGRTFWAQLVLNIILIKQERVLLVRITDIQATKQKEEKLLKDKFLAESYIDLTASIIIVLNKDNTIALLNKYGCELLGVREEEILGKDYFELFIPYHERANLKTLHQNNIGQGNIIEKYENGIQTITGEIKTIAWRNSLVYDENGNVTGTLSIGIDLTEERKREQRVSLVESRLHNLVASLPNAVFYESGGGREYMSENFQNLLGYSAEDFAQNKGKYRMIIHPEDIDKVEKEIGDWENGSNDSVLRLEYRARHADGHFIWIEDLISKIKPMEQDPYHAGILLDISERKQLDQELKESESKFRMLSYSAPIGIFQLDQFGVPIFANKAVEEVCGLKIDEMTEDTIRELVHPSDRNKVFSESQTVSLKQNGLELEFRIIAKGTNKVKWVKVFSQGIRRGELFLGWIGTIEDVTSLKTSALRLQESEQRFRLLSEASNEGVFLSFEDIIIDSNEQFVKMLGFERKDDVLGLKFINFVEENSVALVKENQEGKYNQTYMIKMVGASGSIFSVELKEEVVPYYGRPVRISVLNDVTERKQFEADLKQSNDRYRNLIDYLPLGLFLINSDDQINFANQSAERILGQSHDHLVGMNIYKLLPNDYRTDLAIFLKEIREKGKAVSLETKLLKQGAERLIEVEISARLVMEGKETFVQLGFQDISVRKALSREQMRAQIAEETNLQLQYEIDERQKVETRLLSEQEYKKSLIESSLDMIVSTDLDYNIVEFNPAASYTFGYKQEEIQGLEISALFTNKKSYEEWNETMQEFGQFVGELSLRKKDGRILDVYLTSSKIVVDGKVVGLMGVIRDVTEQKKRQDELRESEERFRVIYNQAFIGIARIAKTGRFILVNKRVTSILGYSPEELNKKLFFELLHPDDLHTVLAKWDLLSTGQIDNFEAEQRYIHKTGAELYVKVSVSLVRDSKGNPQYFIASYEDITERKAAEMQIQDSLKEKEILIKEIHHRVKNNMQVISSILNLQTLYIDDERTIEMLKESQNRIKSMSYIHESLYQSRNLSHFNFTDYIRNLVSNLGQSYNLFKESVEIYYELDQVSLGLDTAIPLGLVINELVTNSFKYAFVETGTGKLEVILKSLGNGNYSLVIADNGKGFPPQIDFRATESLGLQLVTTLVQQIQGKIELDNQKGAIFTILFKENQPEN
jgi:PAS domain S-box-containing protein